MMQVTMAIYLCCDVKHLREKLNNVSSPAWAQNHLLKYSSNLLHVVSYVYLSELLLPVQKFKAKFVL